MKKLAIYPYSRDMLDFVAWAQRFTDEYEINGLYAPSGLGLSDMDAAYGQNRGDTGILVSRDLERMYTESDALLVPSGDLQAIMNCRVLDVLETAAARHLPVLCAMELGDKREHIEKVFSEADTSICFLTDQNKSLEDPILDRYTATNAYGLYQTKATVIMVGGLYADCCDREAALALVDGFRRAGHKATAIVSGDEAFMLGLYPYPASFFSKEKEVEQRAASLNRYLRHIDQRESPEVIVVQLLGGLIPFNKRFPESYGIKPFIAAQAILPDFLVLGTLYMTYGIDLMESLKPVLRNRFGATMLCTYMSNRFANVTESTEYPTLIFDFFDYPDYRKEFAELSNDPSLPVFDITDVKDAERLADYVVNVLQ